MIADRCRFANIDRVRQTPSDCGVLKGAAVPHLDYALDTHYPWQIDEVITGGKLPITNGVVMLPEGPGLGVELDREQLQRLHENYLNCGLKERNDEIEMKKVNPNWQFELQRY